MVSEDDVAICDGGMHRGDLISGNIVYIRVFYIGFIHAFLHMKEFNKDI